MYTKEVIVQSQVGLQSRRAIEFTNKASTFDSELTISLEEKTANAKSLLGVLALAVKRGNTISITADGADEEEAVNSLTDAIESGLTQ